MNQRTGGIRIIELENSFQLCTKQEYYDALIRVCSQPRRYTLTDAALETLSIIAYKQPVTKIEIENIRGVNSDRAVSKLVELGLVKEVGRLDAPGRPMLFGTTEDFLRSFGVQSIDELPTISEDMVEQYKEEAELELASENFDADNQEDSDGQITLEYRKEVDIMERKNAWKKYSDEDKNNVFTFADEYKTFISECKTERECVKRL